VLIHPFRYHDVKAWRQFGGYLPGGRLVIKTTEDACSATGHHCWSQFLQ
jgi:hypothetical protein